MLKAWRIRFGTLTKRERHILKIAGITIVVVVAMQQLMPSSKPLVFVKINGKLNYYSSYDQMYQKLEEPLAQDYTLKAADESYTYSANNLGISLNREVMAAATKPESRLKRLVPFSTLAQILRNIEPAYQTSNKSLSIITKSIADEINQTPTDAQIVAEGENYTISPSQNGRKLLPSEAVMKITESISQSNTTIELPVHEVESDITTSELEDAAEEFSAKIPDKIDLILQSGNSTISKDDMYSWLYYQAKDSKPVIGFNPEKVKAYADQINAMISSSLSPTPTIVYLTDGIETSRTVGKGGKAIDASKLTTQIIEAISQGLTNVSVQLVDVPSPIVTRRTFTKSSAGLQELLKSLTEGTNISIRYADINERGWDVGSRQSERTHMASTYKLFVAYSVLKRIDSGQWHMTDPINGDTVDGCIRKMIVNSDNACSIAMAEKIGWTVIESEGKALGASGLYWKDDVNGTANDPAELLIKLARGQILSPNSRTYLLDLMHTQVYRQGIPAGSSHPVADKVGFLNGHLNDAAIVYSPDMTYVLVIYTYGESWAKIADITSQIEALVS